MIVVEIKYPSLVFHMLDVIGEIKLPMHCSHKGRKLLIDFLFKKAFFSNELNVMLLER